MYWPPLISKFAPVIKPLCSSARKVIKRALFNVNLFYEKINWETNQKIRVITDSPFLLSAYQCAIIDP